MTSPQLKLIFKGALEFGSQRAFEMALKHWQTRLENYFKADILFKIEQVFDVEGYTLAVPQGAMLGSEKAWRSSTALLQEVAQYAVAGNIAGWRVLNGQVLDTANIEPRSDKAAVTEFKRGCELVREVGRESEATAALSRAIEKYERHAAAYERRGYVNYKLKNYNDALYDFSKSIAINPGNAEPYYSRGKVKMVKNDWEGAAADFDQAIRRAIALQPVYWLARMKKGACLLHSKRHAEAAVELKAYVQRTFAENDPNYVLRHRAWILLGKAHAGLGDAAGAFDALLQARALSRSLELTPTEKSLLEQISMPDFEATARADASAMARLLEEYG